MSNMVAIMEQHSAFVAMRGVFQLKTAKARNEHVEKGGVGGTARRLSKQDLGGPRDHQRRRCGYRLDLHRA
jgi:hypothetical protein